MLNKNSNKMKKVIIIKATLEVNEEKVDTSSIIGQIGVEIIPTSDDITVNNIEITE